MSHRAPGRVLTVAVLVASVTSAHGATRYVANNGSDVGGPGACLSKESPCRTISFAIQSAAAGDKIIVGPGRYAADTGETPTPGCGCMLGVNKAVTLMSSDGAGVTLIDGRTAAVVKTVLLIANGGEFGRPGKGFFVTQSGGGNHDAIVIDSDDIALRGNQVIPISPTSIGTGIQMVNSPGAILIEANQVVGWAVGIAMQGANKTVRRNVLLENGTGISTSAGSDVTGNLVVDNIVGIKLNNGATTVVGNAAIANGLGISNNSAGPPNGAAFTGVVQKNDLIANGCGVRNDAVTGLVADRNYWGAATGPGPHPANPICNTSGGTSTVTPFATSPYKVKAPIKP
jgi:hypothetical protein